MPDASFLDWPFFEPRHRDWAREVEAWAASQAEALADEHDADASTQRLARAMGEAGLLRVPCPEDGKLDVRSLCLARDILARHAGLADFAFAMQGLGTGPVTLFGTQAQRDAVLHAARAGTALAAFALSEPEAGSDVAALATLAERDGNSHYRLTGRKTWISNGGIAATYIVFAAPARRQAPWPLGLSWCRPTRRCLTIEGAHRRHRPRIAGDAALRRRAHPVRCISAGPGDAPRAMHAGCVPRHVGAARGFRGAPD